MPAASSAVSPPGPSRYASTEELIALCREMVDFGGVYVTHQRRYDPDGVIESMDEVYSDHAMWFADLGEDAADGIDREALQGAIAEAIAELPEREALVLQLYFVEELNLEEIRQVLGVTAARVCQIKKAALDKVRAKLADWA